MISSSKELDNVNNLLPSLTSSKPFKPLRHTYSWQSFVTLYPGSWQILSMKQPAENNKWGGIWRHLNVKLSWNPQAGKQERREKQDPQLPYRRGRCPRWHCQTQGPGDIWPWHSHPCPPSLTRSRNRRVCIHKLKETRKTIGHIRIVNVEMWYVEPILLSQSKFSHLVMPS